MWGENYIICVWAFVFSTQVYASSVLPYSTRLHDYNGLSSFALGDIRTVGMAGATIGLGDTFLAASDNPAGLAMTLKIGDSNFANNTIHDGHTQNFEDPIPTNSIGAAVGIYPWGFSLGYVTSSREDAPYVLNGFTNPVVVTTTARELRLGVAHLFFENQLSLGLSLNIGQSEEEIQASPNFPDQVVHSGMVGATLGGLYQLGDHFLLGGAYTLPLRYNINTASNPSSGINSFFQDLESPYRVSAGLGWIPNRFFRTDFSIFLVGTNSNSALLSNDSVLVGQSISIQPRYGAAYVFADFLNFRATTFAGLYYETSRIAQVSDRPHLTSGVEGKLAFVTAGIGSDFARDYQNVIVSVGVDIFDVMGRLELIPHPNYAIHGGWFPNFNMESDDGLPRALVKNWNPDSKAINPLQVALDMPKKVADQITALIQHNKVERPVKKKKRLRHKRSKTAPSPLPTP